MRKLFILLLSGTCLFACNTYQANQDEKMAYAATESSEDSYIADSLKLIKTAGLRMKVSQVEQAAPEISSLTKSFGGMVMLYQYDAAEDYSKSIPYHDDSMRVISRFSPQAQMEVRVPSEKLDTFLFSVSRLGYHTGNTHLQIDDRSLAYLRNARKQQVRLNALDSQKFSKRTTNDMVKNIQVQDDVIDQHIDNQAINHDVQFSVVKIDLYQNAVLREEVTVRSDFSAYAVPFSYQLKQAFLSGWKFFMWCIITLIRLWVLLLFVPVVYFIVKNMRKRFPVQPG